MDITKLTSFIKVKVNECPISAAIATQEGADEVDVEQAMKTAGRDLSEFNLEELLKGIEVEKEHTESVGGELDTLIKIATDHLKEVPDYYTRLAKMEEEAKASPTE